MVLDEKSEITRDVVCQLERAEVISVPLYCGSPSSGC